MKNVCFVLYIDYFTPWPLDRARKEIQVLKESGSDITVLSWIKEPLKLPITEVKEGIKVYRFFLQPPKKSFLKRMLAYLKISKEISKKIIEIKPDAIVCHDLEMLYAGVKATKVLKTPLFYDAHENWPAMVAKNSKFEAKCYEILEKRLLKHVSYSYTYGDDLTEKYKSMGFPSTTLYNSKYLEAIPNVSEAEILEIKGQYGFEEDDFIIGYAGGVNMDNGLLETIDALKKLPENIKFFVVGGSRLEKEKYVEKLKRYAKEKGVSERVKFTDRVKSDALLRYTAAFDVGTALFQPLSVNEIARVPNKIFDYMAMSVPMIVSNFPNMKKIVVEESDCGLAVDPRNIEGIAKAVRYFYDHPDETKEKGSKGKAMFEKIYSWDVQKKKLVDSHPIWRG